jgi:putative hydrolase of the HAD superfamily
LSRNPEPATRPPELAGVRVVFFDIGGTLAYPHPSFNGLIAQVCQAHGLAVTPEDAGRVEPNVWAHIARRKDAGRGFSLTTDDSKAFWLWVYRTYLSELGHAAAAETDLPQRLLDTFVLSESYRLYDDVIPTLDRLRNAGYRLGVISNWEAWLDRLMVDLAISDFFEVTVVSGNAGIEKPNPRIFEIALEGAGVQPSEAVHIGDNPTDDIVGAAGVGIRGILLDRNDRFAPVLPKPLEEDEVMVTSPGVETEPQPVHRVRHLLEIADLLGAP